MLSNKPASRTRITHTGLDPSTKLSKHYSFVAIITMARTCSNCRKSKAVLQKPTSGICLFSLTGIFTSELILKLKFEALFKVKELAAARERPREYSCIQSSDSQSQKEPGFGDVTSTTAEVGKRPHGQKWASDHPSHYSINWQRTVQDLTRAK